MKARKETVQAAIITLINKITQTMPNTMYQFILGGATTFATMKSTDKINQMLSTISDENGLVDIDLLQNTIDGAFRASNGRVQLDLFNQPGILNMFVKPITVTITKQDIDELMADIKANAVNNEVSLSNQQQIMPNEMNKSEIK